MARFFISPEDLHPGLIALTGENAAHAKVLRLKPGDAVTVNQTLVIIEAMKMETAITARMDGVVDSIEIKEGDTVKGGQLLLTIR